MYYMNLSIKASQLSSTKRNEIDKKYQGELTKSLCAKHLATLLQQESLERNFMIQPYEKMPFFMFIVAA